MPDTISNHDAAPARLPASIFFDQVIREVHKSLAERKRRHLRNKQVFTIPETAKFTGLSVREVRKLIADQEIEANELSEDSWLIPQEEVLTLIRRHAEERECQDGLDLLAAVEEGYAMEDE
jgi:hypothetical protein